MGIECERKWLVCVKPPFLANLQRRIKLLTIEQFYTVYNLAIKEEIRYRKQDDVYSRTKKSGSALIRQEDIATITVQAYNDALEQKIGSIIRKQRFLCFDGEVAMEVDVYIEPQLPINYIIIEVEFKNKDDAMKFSFSPAVQRYFTRVTEVTEDDRYKNAHIALHGFPNE